MDQVEEREIDINNEYDYSNIVVEAEAVSVLVKYCESYYNQFVAMCDEEEAKNEKLKFEYKNYQYKKTYSMGLEIKIREKDGDYSGTSCKTYESFVEAINAGHLKNVDSLTIDLNLSYKRGKDIETKDHENRFKISFKPYEIVFTRKSNFTDSYMDQIENVINEILKKFRVQNTIFCSK